MLCQRRHLYEDILQIEPKHSGHNPHTNFGHAFHEGLRAYDEARFAGHNNPTLAGVKRAYELSREWPEPLAGYEANTLKASEKAKTAESLARSIVWYDEALGSSNTFEVMVADGKPAFEINFKIPLGFKLPWANNKEALLCGNLDAVVKFGDEVWVLERKSTYSQLGGWYFSKYSPNIQIDVYCLAAHLLWPDWKIQGVLLEAAQIGQTFVRFQRQFLRRSVAQLEETHYAIEKAIKGIEINRWPLNPASCNVGAGCPYRSLCNTDPAMRERLLELEWQRRKSPWNPLLGNSSEPS